jgi:hypothetical protein
VDSFLLLDKDDLVETVSQPPENARLQISREFLLGTISEMEEAVPGSVGYLVFHLDEVGVSEWEDRKSKKAVVSTAMSSQKIHHGVNRTLKHIMVMTCVAASGKHVIPYIIRSQGSDDLREIESFLNECKNTFVSPRMTLQTKTIFFLIFYPLD